jgi:hypothetical protein
VTWEKSGGILGLSEVFQLHSNGSTAYSSSVIGKAKFHVDRAEIETLFGRLAQLTGASYVAMPGSADYFTYRVTYRSGAHLVVVEWVDSGVSISPLPPDLIELQLSFESLIYRMLGQNSTTAGERAAEIAKQFIITAPTFKFDGMLETTKVTNEIVRESFPPQYVITITFESRHAGYGNRSDEFLAQVITPHEAVVTVIRDNVSAAILDGVWDELHQRSLSS